MMPKKTKVLHSGPAKVQVRPKPKCNAIQRTRKTPSNPAIPLFWKLRFVAANRFVTDADFEIGGDCESDFTVHSILNESGGGLPWIWNDPIKDKVLLNAKDRFDCVTATEQIEAAIEQLQKEFRLARLPIPDIVPVAFNKNYNEICQGWPKEFLINNK